MNSKQNKKNRLPKSCWKPMLLNNGFAIGRCDPRNFPVAKGLNLLFQNSEAGECSSPISARSEM